MRGLAYMAIPVAAGVAVALAAGAALPQGGDGARLTASALAAGGTPALGDPAAPVTIVEWGDYQCTFCYRFHASTLGALVEEYVDAGRARIVFRDFPLNGPDSELAAEASRCAADQGMYWEYHDALYGGWAGERTGWITPGSLAGFAGEAGLDAGELAACLEAGTHRRAVAADYAYGRAVGVDATPTFFVFGGGEAVKIRGNQPLEAFRQAVEAVG